MTTPPGPTSTRPYLIRALYEWCTDNGLTPYVAVRVDDTVRVPREYVKDGEIVLNVSMDATSGLNLGNDYIEFKARFAGVARDILVPLSRIIAIYARENGQGMAFPLEEVPSSPATGLASGAGEASTSMEEDTPSGSSSTVLASVESEARRKKAQEPPRPPSGGPRPTLKRVK